MATEVQGGTALSRNRVAEAALALIDSSGLDALSMRRLARELGVGTMTLYHYFPSKRELLDAVVDVGFAGYPPPAVEGPWRERVAGLARTAREALSEHPGLAQIRASAPILRADALQFGEVGLRALEDAGFETEEAVKAFRLLFTYVFGFVLVSPSGAEEANKAAARAALAALPPEYYPRLSEAVDEAAEAMAGDVVFEYGLDRLLDGLELRLGRGRGGQ
jgi:TetR/AcrR family transcriptional regulator, tetracycline repressor protein